MQIYSYTIYAGCLQQKIIIKENLTAGVGIPKTDSEVVMLKLYAPRQGGVSYVSKNISLTWQNV